MKEYMLQKDYSLDVIFRYLDKDNSKGVSLPELQKGIDFLSNEECKVLFEAIDKDRSGEITLNEIVTECSKINCAYVLFKIQEFLKKQKRKPKTPEELFEMFDTNQSGEMEI